MKWIKTGVLFIVFTMTLTACTPKIITVRDNGVINYVPSSQILKLTPDMTFEEIKDFLGGEEDTGASIAHRYNYVVDKAYDFYISCTPMNKDCQLLCTGEQLMNSLKSGVYSRETGITRAKIESIKADMTYREAYCRLGAAVNIALGEQKYHFIYIVEEMKAEETYPDDDTFTFTFDDPDEIIGYSGKEIWEAFANGAPRSPADKLGYITGIDHENKTLVFCDAETAQSRVYPFSDKTNYLFWSSYGDGYYGTAGVDHIIPDDSGQLYWLSLVDGVVMVIADKRPSCMK